VTASVTLGYGIIAIQMVLYGLGMGLTSAPATESIMGGTLGVAVIGSVYASLYGSRLTASLPAGAILAAWFLPAQPAGPSVATPAQSLPALSQAGATATPDTDTTHVH
jgi:hypothetical protein